MCPHQWNVLLRKKVDASYSGSKVARNPNPKSPYE